MDMPVLKLEDLRREIDEIDQGLLDLLTRRVEIGRRVADAKRMDPKAGDGSNLRPGRECQVLNQVLARNRSGFGEESLVRIWREILSANLAQQIEIEAVLHAPAGDTTTALLARDHCAAVTTPRLLGSATEVIEAVAQGTALYGILAAGGVNGRWWRDLCEMPESPDKPRVITRLPFCGVEASNLDGEAYVIAAMPPEPSGLDVTLFAVASGHAPEGAEILDRDVNGMDLVRLEGYHPNLPGNHEPGAVHWIGAHGMSVTAG